MSPYAPNCCSLRPIKSAVPSSLLSSYCLSIGSPRPVLAVPSESAERNAPARTLSLSAAFKTVVESFGQLTFLRVYQGSIERGWMYRNTRTGRLARFGRLVRIHAGQREEIDCADAGDIVGALAAGVVLSAQSRTLAHAQSRLA